MNTTGRDYDRERETESPKRRRDRALRNKARRDMLRQLTEKHGRAIAERMLDGRDIDHIKPLSQGGSNKRSNLRIRDRKENQSDKGTIFSGRKTTRPRDPLKN